MKYYVTKFHISDTNSDGDDHSERLQAARDILAALVAQVGYESFEETDELIRIRAEIFCEKASHKGIIVGNGGSMLKKIGTDAREDMEALYKLARAGKRKPSSSVAPVRSAPVSPGCLPPTPSGNSPC